jgi:hypothetical protein
MCRGRGDRDGRRMVDRHGSHGHRGHWIDDGRTLLDLRDGLLQFHEGGTSWPDHHSLLNVIELLLDGGPAQLELAGGHCGLGYVHQLLDHSMLSFYTCHRHVSYPWHVVHSGDCRYCLYGCRCVGNACWSSVTYSSGGCSYGWGSVTNSSGGCSYGWSSVTYFSRVLKRSGCQPSRSGTVHVSDTCRVEERQTH